MTQASNVGFAMLSSAAMRSPHPRRRLRLALGHPAGSGKQGPHSLNFLNFREAAR